MTWETQAVELEIITVKIGEELRKNYEGFGGTFATLADSCMRKKILPGVYEEGITVDAEVKDKILFLSLSGDSVNSRVVDLLDIALKNSGAFPVSGGQAHFQVEVRK